MEKIRIGILIAVPLVIFATVSFGSVFGQSNSDEKATERGEKMLTGKAIGKPFYFKKWDKPSSEEVTKKFDEMVASGDMSVEDAKEKLEYYTSGKGHGKSKAFGKWDKYSADDISKKFDEMVASGDISAEDARKKMEAIRGKGK
mgnify:FL=1